MTELTLDQETHIYKVNDRIIPGVTSVLQHIVGVKPYWTEWHRQKGAAVHHAIHLHVQNKLDWSTVDERIKGRIEAFQLFMSDTGYTVIESEMKLFSKRYQFAGTLDLWMADMNLKRNMTFIADIKPPSPEPIVELQLAAYSLLLGERNAHSEIKKACAVCLKDNGRYSLDWVPNLRRSQSIFLSFLTSSNWLKENG